MHNILSALLTESGKSRAIWLAQQPPGTKWNTSKWDEFAGLDNMKMGDAQRVTFIQLDTMIHLFLSYPRLFLDSQRERSPLDSYPLHSALYRNFAMEDPSFC